MQVKESDNKQFFLEIVKKYGLIEKLICRLEKLLFTFLGELGWKT